MKPETSATGEAPDFIYALTTSMLTQRDAPVAATLETLGRDFGAGGDWAPCEDPCSHGECDAARHVLSVLAATRGGA